MTRPHRALQPGTLVPDGPRLWVLDQLQPVGVLLDADSGAVLDRMGWADVLHPGTCPDWPGGWLGETTGRGLLVQAPHRDGVALLRPGRPAFPVGQDALAAPRTRVRPFWVDGAASRVEGFHGPGTTAGDRTWVVGWSRADRDFPRPVHAVGTRTDGDRRQVLLGHGAAVTAVTHRGAVWVALESQRLLATYTRPEPVAVVRLAAGASVPEVVLPADAVDVTDLCWPLLPEPDDPWAFAELWRDRLQLQAPRWSVTVTGRWPRTELEIVLPHPHLPGVRLRRRCPLYDELGREAPPEYAWVHVEEQLATAGPPAAPAGGTVVDF